MKCEKCYKPLKVVLAVTLWMGGVVTLQAADHAHRYHDVWQKAFGGGRMDKAYAVAPAPKGGAVVAGFSRSFRHGSGDMAIVRINRAGNVVWRSIYGGEGYESANAITRTTDGNYVAVGVTKSYSEDRDEDIFVVKFNDNGDKIWQRHFGGKGDDEAKGVTATADGGVVITGVTNSTPKGYDIYDDVFAMRVDKKGNRVWYHTYGGKKYDFGNAITWVRGGGYVIAGGTESYGKGDYDDYIIKIDEQGKKMWEIAVGGENPDVANAITHTKDGGVVVVGTTGSYGSKHNDINVLRLDRTGKIKWHKIFGFKKKESGHGVCTTGDGGFMVAGSTESFGHGKHDFYLLKVNAAGTLLWNEVYGGEDKEIAYAITRTSDHGYVAVGDTDSYGKGSYDFFMVKIK